MVGIEVPPVRDRSTLKYYEQRVRDPDECSDGHDEPNDPDVDWVNCDTQQEQPDGNLEDRGRDGVEHLAEEPVPERSLCAFVRDVLAMLTGSMNCTSKLAC